ncbi:MAG TPA: hypothetical protein VG537_11245 [Candidatus Kapabacteria bacterium]|jgi:hypothetical protein|nr:hypothetical protein [Candidatus Kapabacteria bacterium]
MMESQRQPNDQPHSASDANEKSAEYENFESAVRRIMKQSPEEAEKIRKAPAPKDPDERESS